MKNMLAFAAAFWVAGAAAAQAPSAEDLKPLPVQPKASTQVAVAPLREVTPEDILYLDLSTGGRVAILMRPDIAPKHVERIRTLVRQHFYDGTIFHRVIDGFMAQTGDPNTVNMPRSAWGTGGPGYMFGPEFDATLHYDRAGVVGMARTSDPNSYGSQFFITFAAAPTLDGAYTIFATVTEGLNVLPLIARNATPTTPPTTPTIMTRVYIVERPL